MRSDELRLKFQGFHPSDFMRSFLNDEMSALHEEAPYGSILHATFRRKDHSFKGMVSIHSSVGKFFAVASGSQLKAVTHKLIDQMRKQLDRWKSRRFEHERRKEFAYPDNAKNDYDANSVA